MDLAAKTEARADTIVKTSLATYRYASTSPHHFNTIPYKQNHGAGTGIVQQTFIRHAELRTADKCLYVSRT